MLAFAIKKYCKKSLIFQRIIQLKIWGNVGETLFFYKIKEKNRLFFLSIFIIFTMAQIMLDRCNNNKLFKQLKSKNVLPTCVTNNNLSDYIEWNQQVTGAMVPRHLKINNMFSLKIYIPKKNNIVIDVTANIFEKIANDSIMSRSEKRSLQKRNNKRKRINNNKEELRNAKEVIKMLRSKGINMVTRKKWNNHIKPEIEDGTEDFMGVGSPVLKIEKKRKNTNGKGTFLMWDDGTIAFVFDEICKGMTLERTKVVIYAEPRYNEQGDSHNISINTFANAYNIPCGNTGQKNGKEWLFGKEWKHSKDYHKYAEIVGEDIKLYDDDTSSSE